MASTTKDVPPPRVWQNVALQFASAVCICGEQRSVGSLRSPTGRSPAVENVENLPARWNDVMKAIRRTAGLGRLSEPELRRSASIAKAWRNGGRTLDEIVWAIQGWRALTDRGMTWLAPGTPFSLRALHGTRCIVHHHSGETIVRAAIDVALEASNSPRSRAYDGSWLKISELVSRYA